MNKLGAKVVELTEQNLDHMTSSEQRATRGLASIYALRMMGLFMILPVFALVAVASLRLEEQSIRPA